MKVEGLRRPGWVDPAEYPFADRWLDLEAGRLHYVDEGAGRPVVMVHGTPSWSFLYRRLVHCLSPRWRAVVPDHLGFGLSDKPSAFPHRPADHARNLERLIDHLELRDITLVVHDFGGPIGLSYAVRHPENVRSIVLLNTWLWSLQGRVQYEISERVFASALGRTAYLRLNLSPRYLVPLAYGDRRKLSETIHRHYLGPFQRPRDRLSLWVFAKELTQSGRWYDSLWRRRAVFQAKPTLILWGMKDRFMPKEFLVRWQEALPNAQLVRYPQAGHFVQEEEAEEVCGEVRRFLLRQEKD